MQSGIFSTKCFALGSSAAQPSRAPKPNRTRARPGRVLLNAIVVTALVSLAGGIAYTIYSAAKPAPTPTPHIPGSTAGPVDVNTSQAQPQPAPHTDLQTSPQTTGAASPPPVVNEKLDATLNAVVRLKTDREWGQAKAVLEEALQTWPAEQQLHVQLAEVFVALEQPAEAHASYERALATGTRSAEIEFAAGTAASAANKLERAAEHFAAAQTARPNDYLAPLFLAQVQVKQNLLSEAKKNLLLSSRLKPEIAITWGTLAEIALRENVVSLAVQHAQRARDLEPTNALWRLLEARALKRDNKPSQALALFEGMEPTDLLEPSIVQLLGECYGLAGRPKDGALMFERLVKAETTRGDLVLQTAQWWERAGDNAKALHWAQRAMFMQVDGAEAMHQRLKALAQPSTTPTTPTTDESGGG